MAKSRFIQTSFASGELSPLLKGRTDLNQYYAGCSTAENVVIVPQGGLKRRAGTSVVGEGILPLIRNTTTPTMPSGGTAGNINDGNLATNTTTNVIGTGGTSGQPDFVVAHYDITSTTTEILFLDIRKIKTVTVSATVCNLKLQYSTDNAAWTTAQEFAVNNTEKTFRKRVTLAKRYWRLVRAGDSTGDLGSQTINLAEFNLQTEKAIGTETTNAVKMFDFAVEHDRQYLCVLTEGNMAIYLCGNTTLHSADLIMDYTETEIMDVRHCQTEQVMLLFHENHASKRIINDGSSNYDSFALDDIPYLNVPQYDYNDSQSPTPVDDVQRLTFNSFVAGDTYQIDIEGVLSKNITFAGVAGADQQNSTVFNLQKNLQEMPVFGETGVTVTYVSSAIFDITISGESTKDFELYSGFPTSGTASKTLAFVKTANGSPRKEDVWSTTRGYPKMGAFHSGRLWLGGTKSKTQSLFASKSGSFFDFFFEDGADDEGMFLTLTSKNLTSIVNINSDRGLQVFTRGAEFVVENNTPSTVSIVSQTQHGSLPVEIISTDGASLFVDQNGQSIRQYVFSFNEDAYTSEDISVLSSHLIKTPVDISVLSGTSSEDANWVFIVNTDGTASILNTVRSQDINGFTSVKAAANIDDATNTSAIQSCVVVQNEMYQVAKRFQTGAGYRWNIEKWNYDRMLDGAYFQDSSLNTITTLDIYNGCKLQVVGGKTTDGVIVGRVNIGEKTVSNGEITLTNDEITGIDCVEVGFPFTPTIEPMPINTTIGSGDNVMREKKICRMNLRVYESAGIYIDGNPVPNKQFSLAATSPVGTVITPRTDVIQDNNGGNGWGINVVPVITVPNSMPFQIQAIEYEVESS